MARRRPEGLEHVLGVNALFSTAYGNVDFLSHLAIVVAGVLLVFSPDVLSQNMSYLGEAPRWRDFLIAIPASGASAIGQARIQGALLFGETLEAVLAERPCRVVIESTAASDGAVQRQIALQRERA